MTSGSRRLLALLSAVALSSVGFVSLEEATAAPASETVCEAMTTPVQQVVDPRSRVSRLVTTPEEIAEAAARGMTEERGVVFHAATRRAPGLTHLRYMQRPGDGDLLASTSRREWTSAGREHGYLDQGTAFYVSPRPAECLEPVHRMRYGGIHRQVLVDDVAAARDEGWIDEGVSFYAAPAPEPEPEPDPEPEPEPEPEPPVGDEDGVFSFAVIPDTQQEVFGGTRFIDRNRWLVEQQDELSLEFVNHTGDIVNWDTEDHAQFEFAREAMSPLRQAGIPYSVAIGNHDTAAVGPGGGAADPERTPELLRDTTTFNEYFTAEQYGGVDGAFEEGKVDNVYTLHEIEGSTWMVLVLEMWPRPEAVEWAKQVVEQHPEANVLVSTHQYLDSDFSIGQSRGYGATSPQYLWDELVGQYPNIKMVVSGHVGQAGSRRDTGVNGNTVHSFLTTFHSRETNPVRLFEVDLREDTLETWIYAPATEQRFSEYDETLSGLDWIDDEG